jgi:hypothetical protein
LIGRGTAAGRRRGAGRLCTLAYFRFQPGRGGKALGLALRALTLRGLFGFSRSRGGFFLRLLLLRALQLRLGLRLPISGLLRLSLGLPPGLLGLGFGPSRLFSPARLFVSQGLCIALRLKLRRLKLLRLLGLLARLILGMGGSGLWGLHRLGLSRQQRAALSAKLGVFLVLRAALGTKTWHVGPQIEMATILARALTASCVFHDKKARHPYGWRACVAAGC